MPDDSEFARCSGSYKRQAMLQFDRERQEKTEVVVLIFRGPGAVGVTASESVRAGMAADAQDAAGLNHIKAELLRAGEQCRRFRAGVQPDLARRFFRPTCSSSATPMWGGT